MKKDIVLKALERMNVYFRDAGNETMAGLFMSKDDTYIKAWIRTCEQLEIDELDERSKIWFIEDESRFAQEYAKMLEDAAKLRHMVELMAKNLDEMDDDEY